MTNSSNLLTRRTILKSTAAAAGVLAAPGLVGRAFAQDEALTVFSWETYHLPEWIEEWTAKSGIPVNVVLTGSADEMYGKMAAGAIDPDIIVVDTGSFPRHIASGFITPVDVAKIPNAANVSAGMNFQTRNLVDGKLYGVPYNWGVQPLMYARSVGEEGMNTWSALWDPRFAGKVNLFDDGYATIPMIAIKVGAKDPYHLTEEEFGKVIEALRELRPLVGQIARGPSDQTAAFASGDALVGYCMVVNEVIELNADGQNRFGYSFPAEGALGWIDNMAITPKGQRDAAYQFINDMLTPEWQARFVSNSSTNGVLSLEAAQAAGITPDALAKTTIPDQVKEGFWEKLSVFAAPEDIERRLQIWNDFKAGIL